MPIIEINQTPVHKNVRGDYGPICNNCGGYGFTNFLSDKGGGSAGCLKCGGSGVEQPDINKLRRDVDLILAEIQGLKNIVIKEAKRRI